MADSPSFKKQSWASSFAVRRNMQANRGRDTGPEMELRRVLHRAGLRYRVHFPVPTDRRRRIDIAFTRSKLAVFVDGCFWHRCPKHYIAPKAHGSFWDSKIRGNVERDAETAMRLAESGWIVLRFWEHESAQESAAKIQAVLGATGGGRMVGSQ